MEDTPILEPSADVIDQSFRDPTEKERRDNFLKIELLCFAERVLQENEETWWREEAIFDFLSEDLNETRARLKRIMNQLIDEGRVARKAARDLPKGAVRGRHQHSATRGVVRLIDKLRTKTKTYVRTNDPRTVMASDYPSIYKS